MQNSFPMKEWHIEHMQETVVKYVKGLSDNASGWEKRNHRKYGGLTNICRQIEYDIKHGVTNEQVISMFGKVRNDSSFSELRRGNGWMKRLEEVEGHFTRPKPRAGSFYAWENFIKRPVADVNAFAMEDQIPTIVDIVRLPILES